MYGAHIKQLVSYNVQYVFFFFSWCSYNAAAVVSGKKDGAL